MEAADLVERGQAALRAGDWTAARSAFQDALATQPIAAAEGGLATALLWLNRIEEARQHWEHAYRLAKDQGDRDLAGRMAIWMSRYYFLGVGDAAVASGWIARADRVLSESNPCPAQAWLAIVKGQASGDPRILIRSCEEAAAIARRVNDVDMEILALAYKGLGLCTSGLLNEGMHLLDEAMAAATGGEVIDLAVVGDIYCAMLTACERAVDFERADQWCRVANGYVQRHKQTPMSGSCRACYGSVLTATGRWSEAEQELLGALRSFDVGFRAMRADALVRLANLRIREGRVDEAQHLLEGIEHHPDAQRPLAALQAARGMGELAVNTLRRRLDQLGKDSAERAPVLALLVEVQIGLSDVSGARSSVAAIEALASRDAPDSLQGLSHLARARVQHASREPALADLEAALQFLLRAEMPFEAAECRLLMAQEMEGTQQSVAHAHARQALESFARLGAAREQDRAVQLMQQLGGAARTGPKAYGPLSRREEDVLRLLAQGLSNEQIAARLFISRRTAEHHVSSILSKLGLSSRAEAAAYAARRPAEIG